MSVPVTINFKMDAISVQQPWAWLIVNRYKPLENRTWATARRGPHLIHTGKKLDRDGYAWIRQEFPEIPLPPPEDLNYGGIIGMVEIVDCVAHHPSRWFFGPFAFVMEKAATLPFIPCRGALGFFKPKLGVNNVAG